MMTQCRFQQQVAVGCVTQLRKRGIGFSNLDRSQSEGCVTQLIMTTCLARKLTRGLRNPEKVAEPKPLVRLA